MKIEFNAEIKRMAFNKAKPIKKAPMLYRLENRPILKIESVVRQLNPWNKRAKHNVENAIVAANP